MKKARFNIIDAIIIIIVLIIVFLGYKLINSSDNQLNSGNYKTTSISYEVLSSGNSRESVDMPEIGDDVYDSTTTDYLGEISNVSITEHEDIYYDENSGVYVEKIVPNSYDIKITITGEGYSTESDIFVNGHNIKVGDLLNVKSKGYVFITYVININE